MLNLILNHVLMHVWINLCFRLLDFIIYRTFLCFMYPPLEYGTCVFSIIVPWLLQGFVAWCASKYYNFTMFAFILFQFLLNFNKSSWVRYFIYLLCHTSVLNAYVGVVINEVYLIPEWSININWILGICCSLEKFNFLAVSEVKFQLLTDPAVFELFQKNTCYFHQCPPFCIKMGK